MNRNATRMWWAAALVLTAVSVESAIAGPFPSRSPQVSFQTAALQGYLNGLGESVNVASDQLDASIWATSVSGNTLFTLMIEVAANASANAIGVYNADDPNPTPTMFQLFPGAASAGWYAVASFQSSGKLIVSLFDDQSNFQGQTVYTGVNAQKFGFYLAGPGGTFYTQDARNAGDPHALVFAGTGNNIGDWWMCFEDLPYNSGTSDFDDAVLLLQSVAPTPARNLSWGGLKALYR